MAHQINPALLHALKNGDEKALEAIFHLYKDKLYAYCFKILKTKDLTDEVVADVFIALWRKRDQLAETISFEAYLVTIARNLAIDSLKRVVRDDKLHHEVLLGAILAHSQPEENLNYQELQAAIDEAIQNLPAQRRRIFLMSREGNYSHQEIAEKLRISKNTVKDQIVKSLADIKTYLYLKGHTDIPMVILYFLLHRK